MASVFPGKISQAPFFFFFFAFELGALIRLELWMHWKHPSIDKLCLPQCHETKFGYGPSLIWKHFLHWGLNSDGCATVPFAAVVKLILGWIWKMPVEILFKPLWKRPHSSYDRDVLLWLVFKHHAAAYVVCQCIVWMTITHRKWSCSQSSPTFPPVAVCDCLQLFDHSWVN